MSAIGGRQEKNRGRVPLKYDCGVPMAECSGSLSTDHNGNAYKVHSDLDAARKCGKRWAKSVSPPGGAIMLPPKPQRIKIGKGKRFMRVPVRG